MARKKILIVEDQVIVALTIESLLNDSGYDTIGPVREGEEVMEVLKNEEADLILLDIILDGKMNGIEVANQVKEKYDVPIIFLTASSSDGLYKQAKEANPFGFINKPFEDNDLIRRIDLAIYNHHSEKELRKSEQRNKALLENIPDTILVIDRDERLIKFNHESSHDDFLKITENQIGESLESILPTELYKPIQEAIAESKAQQTNLDLNLEINFNKSDDQKYIEIRALKTIEKEIIIIIRDITEKIELNRILEKLKDEDELKKTKELLRGQDIERKRLSKDLHDGIGQLLTVTKRKLSEVEKAASEAQYDKDLKDKFGKAVNYINDVINDVRKISQNLMPTVLEDFGIKAALNKLCNGSTTGSIHVNFSFSGEDIRLDENTELMLYRIAQEAINNSIKHSNATTVNVMLEIDSPNQYKLIIADDGEGFNPNEENLSKGSGLRNIQERSKVLNGDLNIQSEKKTGTIISLTINNNE